MRTTILLLISLLILSCASTQKEKDKLNIESETLEKLAVKSQQSTESESQGESTTNKKLISDLTNFSITPPVGGFADFELNYGGRLISGRTSGTINYNNEKKSETIITQTIYRIKSKIYNTYQAITTRQTKYKIKQVLTTKTVTIEYPWYFWLGSAAALLTLWEILRNYLKKVFPLSWLIKFITKKNQNNV